MEGHIELLETGRYVLHLKGFCFIPEQADFSTDGAIGFSDDPAKIAADYAPRSIFGRLSDGALISLLDAHMESGPVFSVQTLQRFNGQRYVLGAHISNETEAVRGIRWTWDLPSGIVGWAREVSAVPVLGELSGTIHSWESEQYAGLELEAVPTVPLHRVLKDVVSSTTQLVGLWTGLRPPKVTAIEFRQIDGTWCSYVRPSEEGRLHRSSLLPMTDLSLQKFADWIRLAIRIDPFPYIINAPTNVLQVDAQVLATAIEGLHRRLHAEDRPFSGMSKHSVKRAIDKARRAGVAALESEGLTDSDLADRLLRGSLNHVDQPTYQNRLLQLAEPVWALAPGLCGPDPMEWADMVKKIRNDQSHQLVRSFLEGEIAVYFVATITCRWVLLLRILTELVSANSLKDALLASDRFLYALANIDGEQLWADFSALSTFRAESTPSRNLDNESNSIS